MNRLLTILARPAWRGRRTLPLVFTAFLAFTASCSHDYAPCPDCPGAAALIPGTFVLAAVDGKVLPFTLPDSSVTFLAGDAVTTSDDKFTLSLTTVTKGDTATANTAGFVLPYNRGTVTFHFSASAVQAQALITGNGFSLQYNSVILLFERVG